MPEGPCRTSPPPSRRSSRTRTTDSFDCLIVGKRQEAEDVCQEAFAKVWERWDQVAAMDNPIGYLHRTAMNVFRSRYRRSQVASRLGLRVADAEDAFAAIDDRHVALQALRTLAPRQHRVQRSPGGVLAHVPAPCDSGEGRGRHVARVGARGTPHTARECSAWLSAFGCRLHGPPRPVHVARRRHRKTSRNLTSLVPTGSIRQADRGRRQRIACRHREGPL